MEEPKERGTKRTRSAFTADVVLDGDEDEQGREKLQSGADCQGLNGKDDSNMKNEIDSIGVSDYMVTTDDKSDMRKETDCTDESQMNMEMIAKRSPNVQDDSNINNQTGIIGVSELKMVNSDDSHMSTESNNTEESKTNMEIIAKEADLMEEILPGPNLPGDIIVFILEKLSPCSAELVPLKKLNRQLNREITRILHANPELPSLILPSSEQFIFHSTTACEMDRRRGLNVPCRWQELRVPDNIKESRFCGSSDGGWLYLQHPRNTPKNVLLFNVSTGQLIRLPSTIDLTHQYQQIPTVRVKALATSWISATKPNIVAAIVETTLTDDTIALWRDPMTHWEHVICPNSFHDPLQDVIFFRNRFCFVTLNMLGQVIPEIEDDGQVWGNWEEVELREIDMFNNLHSMARRGNLSTRRYLVESEQELFCVTKLLDVNDNLERRLNLLVYRLTRDNLPIELYESSSEEEEDEEEDEQYESLDEEEEEQEEEEEEDPQGLFEEEDEDGDEDLQDLSEEEDEEEEDEEEEEEEEEKPQRWAWVNASDILHNRVLFVGQASSRSFPTETEGRVYFFDDDHVQPEGLPGEYLRDNMGFVLIDQSMEFDLPTIWPVIGNPLPRSTSDKSSPCWWFH